MAQAGRPMRVLVSPLLRPDDVVFESGRLTSKLAPVPPDAFATGCQWEPLLSIRIGHNWSPGPYAVRLTNDADEFVMPFALKPRPEARGKTLVVMNTNTWQAYNQYGGSSFYRYKARHECRWGSPDRPKRGSRWASFHRPNPLISDDARRAADYFRLIEKRMEDVAEGLVEQDIQPPRVDHLLFQEALAWTWMEASGVAFDLTTDYDLHRHRIPGNYKTVVLVSHPEYWSEEMWAHLRGHVARGGNLISLAGNVIHRRVAFGGGQGNLRIQKAVVERDGVFSQIWTDVGGRNHKPLTKVGAAEPGLVLGSCYDNRAYNTYAPYQIRRPDHWIFEGCDTSGALGALNFNGMGASGHETDTAVIRSATVLAEGKNGPGGAHILAHDIGKARVFNVGSIAFCGSLHVCPSTARMTKNVMQGFSA